MIRIYESIGPIYTNTRDHFTVEIAVIINGNMA